MVDIKVIEAYINSGLKIIPLQADKTPVQGFKWKDRTLDAAGFERMDFDKIGLVCGKISGGVEVIDFDLKYDNSGTLFDDFITHAEEIGIDLSTLVIEKTINGGYHLIYRCDEISGNEKLARREATDEELMAKPKEKVKCMIETRGEGGYIVVAPSAGYNVVMGDILNIPILTADHRNSIIAVCRSFDQIKPEPEKDERKYRKEYDEEVNPFEDFNERVNMQELLEMQGWKYVFTSGRNEYYQRDGSENKYGATYHLDKRVFYVFSSSSELDNEKGYSPVQVLCKLNFNGDWSETVKWLVKAGYGKFRRPVEVQKASTEVIDPVSCILKPGIHDNEIEQWRLGNIEMGKSLGYTDLDDYFVYKQGWFYCFNGFPNVGKTSFILWLAFILAKLYDITFTIYSGENSPRSLKIKVMQFYADRQVKNMSPDLKKESLDWVEKHFQFVDNSRTYTGREIMDIFETCTSHVCVLDPFTSMKRERNSRASHYDVVDDLTTDMQAFTRRTGKSLWVNLHSDTESSRQREKDGQPRAPRPQDTLMGMVWWAKCDTFSTIHRMVYDAERWMYTMFWVRKERETETGGRPSEADNPIVFRLEPGGCSFVNELGEYPARGVRAMKEVKQFVPNINFYEVDKSSDDTPF